MKYAQDNGLEIDSSCNQLTNLQHLDRICVPRTLVESMVGYVTHVRASMRLSSSAIPIIPRFIFVDSDVQSILVSANGAIL